MKKIIVIVVVVLIIAVAAGILYISFIKNDIDGDFKLDDYNEYIDFYNNNFTKEKKVESVGPIDSPQDAKKAAETIWIEVYGDSVKQKKPYHVRFDEENQVWFVCGTVLFMEGGPNILIQKSDGKILAIWQNKF